MRLCICTIVSVIFLSTLISLPPQCFGQLRGCERKTQNVCTFCSSKMLIRVCTPPTYNNSGRPPVTNYATYVPPAQLDCLKFLLSLPGVNTEIQNIQGRRAGEDMRELMRDESNDEETVRLLTESRVRQGITRL